MTELEQQIADLEEEQTSIYVEIQPKQKRLSEIYEKLRPLQERKKALLVEAMELDSVVDWPMIIRALADNNLSSSGLLRYADKHLRNTFDMTHSGYWSDTQEANFQLTLRQTAESLQKNTTGVKYFATIRKPHPDGWIYFGIFEYTLSAGGSFKLLVKPDLSAAKLVCTTYGHEKVLQEFTSVDAAVIYIQDNHPYDRELQGDES
jgi:hypothetical protein